MNEHRPIRVLKRHLVQQAPYVSGALGQSRRLEGQFDHGGELRGYAEVHLLIEKGIDPAGPAVRDALRAMLLCQRDGGVNTFHANVRGFPFGDGSASGADRIRIEVRDTATASSLVRCLSDAAKDAIPQAEAARRPVRSMAGPDDLVLMLSHNLTGPVDSALLDLTRKTQPRRIVRVGVAEQEFVVGLDSPMPRTKENKEVERMETSSGGGKTRVVGYSERGLVNALVHFLRQDLGRVKSFIHLIEFSRESGPTGQSGAQRGAEVAEKLQACTFIVEAGFADFGDPDLILVCQKHGDARPWIFFVEAKVVPYAKSAISNEDKMSARGFNSSINGQLSLRYRLANALAHQEATNGGELAEPRELYDRYREQLGDQSRQPRHLCKETNLQRLGSILATSCPNGVSEALRHTFFVALTVDELDPFRGNAGLDARFFPLYLGQECDVSLATQHTGWVGWHVLATKLSGLDKDPDFSVVWEWVMEDLKALKDRQGE